MVDFGPVLQQIRDRLVLSEVIGKNVKLWRKGQDFEGLCPFHKEKTPSFKVNDQKAFYHCFGCGTHGDVISYIMHQRGLKFRDAVEDLCKELGISLGSVGPQKTVDSEIIKALESACQWYEDCLKKTFAEPTRQYLEKRAFSKETVSFFRLGYAPDERKDGLSLYKTLVKTFSKETLLKTGLFVVPDNTGDPFDRFRGRLMFPIHNLQGQVVAFGGRIQGNGEPKYLNSADSELFHKGSLLYNYHHAKKHVHKETPFIVVEGYCDVIALHQAGFTSAVAPLGTAFTVQQVELLWRRCPSPLICFDGDAAGQKALWRAAERALPHISEEKTLCFITLPEGEDPDSLLRKKQDAVLKNLFKNPTPLVHTVWEHVKTQFMPLEDLSPERKAAFRKALQDVTAHIQNPTLKNFYQRDLFARFDSAFFRKQRYDGKQVPPLKNLFVKKNTLWQKILLAIIIKHPKLLTEVFEQFFQIRFEDERFEKLQGFLGDYDVLNEEETLEQTLKNRGFEETLGVIFDHTLFVHAAFLKESVTQEDVLKHWNDIWLRKVVHNEIKKDSKLLTNSMKTSFNMDLWNQLKALKTKKLSSDE
jgi:DNA primase